MKKIVLIVAVSLLTSLISTSHAQQTYTQQLPDDVNEIRIEGNVRLIVKPTDGPTALQTLNQQQVASVKNRRLSISDSRFDVTLLLPEGRSMTFNVEDYANLLFRGSFGKRQQLSVHTEDYSSATFSGNPDDSLYAVNLSLQADDYSKIISQIRLVCFNLNLNAEDYSRIDIAPCIKTIKQSNNSSTQTIQSGDYAHLTFSFCDPDSILGAYVRLETNPTSHKYQITNEEYQRESIWHHRDVALTFAWGFHNWGTDKFNGFDGVNGDAAIRTSFNNIQFAINYPLFGTRHFGFYVGLGLEWDKYKFEGNEITFSTAINPYAFNDGGDPSCTSWLNTRYVELPITFRFDLWNDWSLTLSAIPGIHWGGSHTGLRREYITDLEESIDYDRSVNKYINPYKLDFRATLNYEGIGLYVQVPTLSTMRDNTQPLYPIKFGIILTQD